MKNSHRTRVLPISLRTWFMAARFFSNCAFQGDPSRCDCVCVFVLLFII